jgi:catechol 1,2-dioxygenase
MYKEYQSFVPKGKSDKLSPTSPDILGPFYKEGAPERNVICPKEVLDQFKLRSKVLTEKGEPVKHCVVEVWQADAKGVYDNDGFNFRGKTLTGYHGTFHITTVTPGCYEIGENEFRCPHIHVKLTAGGFKELVTQLYFSNADHNDEDHWFDPARVVVKNEEGYSFTFVLESL